MRLVLIYFSFLLCCKTPAYGATLGLSPEEVIRKYMEGVQAQPTSLHHHTFDYRFSRVSDLEYEETTSLLSVLEGVRRETQEAVSFSDLSLVLSENYITDTGFEILVNFLLEEKNKDLLKAISFIDLGNNRITSRSGNNIEKILSETPSLRLDLSINYISPRDISSPISERVDCRAF